MPHAHLICHLPPVHPDEIQLNLRRLPDGRIESGIWSANFVSPRHAPDLLGGMLYLHRTKNQPSYLGGIVEEFEIGKRECHRFRHTIFIIRLLPVGEGVPWAGRNDPQAIYSGLLP
jgi:hypothetical protein